MAVTRLVSRIPQIIAESEVKAALAVEKTAHDIEAKAKERSRVDTGQMRDGWETHPLSPLSASVQNSVEHVIYNEFGTEDMSAQPMLIPSVEEEREPFILAMAECYQ
jgi:HK97 gp10 family phage protein